MADEKRSGNRRDFADDREKVSRAGQGGGQIRSGNFTRDGERAVEAGQKDGCVSHHGPGSEPHPDSTPAAGWEVDHNPVDDNRYADLGGRSHAWSLRPLVDLRGWYS